MRRIGLVLLIAVEVSACRSPSLVGRPDALGPSVVVRHVVEIDVDVPEEHAEALKPGREIGRAVPRGGLPVGRTTRNTRDETGTATSEDGPDGMAATTGLAPRWTGGEGHVPPTDSAEPATATARREAQDGDLATAQVSPVPMSTEPVEGERARSGVSTSPWPWAALAVFLILAAVVTLRRSRARSRLRTRRFDPDDAWDVFQAGLTNRPGDRE